MSENIRSSLSALMDNEANELELQRVLSQSEQVELRTTWSRYHMARRALHGDAAAPVEGLDISARVRAAIASEDDGAVPARASGSFANWSVLRPAASFAVAASVFAAVLVGSQLYGLMGANSAVNADAGLATRVSTVGMVNSIGGAALNATYGTPAIKTNVVNQRAAYNQLARKRLQRYMLPHTDQAVLNSAQGMMPYARVASFQAQE